MGFEKFVRAEFFDTTTYFTKDYLKSQPDKVQAFYDLAWKHHATWRPFLRLIMARHNWEATHRLGEVSAPTLVVDRRQRRCRQQSRHTGRRAMRSASAMPSDLIVKGQSHGFFWQAPDETNAWILDWVTRHSQSRKLGAVG